jgi:ribosomal protein S18 acetylase RimI-like enzyme
MHIFKTDLIKTFSKTAFFSSFTAKILLKQEKKQVLNLFEKCHDFFKLIYTETDLKKESENLFTDLPKNKTYRDKLLLGLYPHSSPNLIGILDLIKDYPKPDCWYVGLLLLDPAYRNKGFSSRFLTLLESTIKKNSGNEIKLIVQEQNILALKFWEKHKFIIEKTTVEKHLDHNNITYHFSKKL